MEHLRTTCIIVGDEPANHKTLDWYIAAHGRLKILGRCFDAYEAMKTIRKKKPQLVFLDVNMPSMSGLEMLEEIPDMDFKVIIVTASHIPELNLVDKRIKGVLPKMSGESRFLQMVGKVIAGMRNGD